MRKQIISQDPQNILPADQSWLDLQHVARVELTSEDRRTRSKRRWYRARDLAGRPHKPESRRSAFCLTSRKGSAYSTSVSRRATGALARVFGTVVAGRWSILPGDCASAT